MLSQTSTATGLPAVKIHLARLHQNAHVLVEHAPRRRDGSCSCHGHRGLNHSATERR
jgi:hypothetical protein